MSSTLEQSHIFRWAFSPRQNDLLEPPIVHVTDYGLSPFAGWIAAKLQDLTPLDQFATLCGVFQGGATLPAGRRGQLLTVPIYRKS